MDLSLRSLMLYPAQLQNKQQPFAASQPLLLVQKSQMRIWRCSLASGKGHEAAQENSLAKGAAQASWLQPDAISDSFFGWIPDNAQLSHSDDKAGWIKVGGIVILAVGFALGAQALYTKQVTTKKSVAMLPLFEQILSSTERTESVKRSNNEMNQSKAVQNDATNPDIQPGNSTSAGVPRNQGRVSISPPVDHIQEQFLIALQALKVIEASVDGGDICTRREYARWLLAASAKLSRSLAHKVFPAMYIKGVTKLAYADVSPEDEDFPCIQGLAEAGLISSRLLQDDGQEADSNGSLFSPDRPLTRQDLITWKMALEKRSPLSAGDSCISAKTALQELSGFIDIDRIRQDAWPALLADIKSGERSIIALAFGYTRRFQPEKPVTKAQVAVALATGEAWELVSEELARLEAESIAEAAVAAELSLETKAHQEVAAAFNALLQAERVKQQEMASLVERLQVELGQIKAEREEEISALLKERAELDCQRNLLSSLKSDLEQQALLQSSAKLEVSFQKERMDKLLSEAEKEKGKVNKLRVELEVEKNALTLARTWAEDEARRALAHSKLLEQVRKRWEYGGVQVRVDKELDDMNIPGPRWHYSEDFQRHMSLMDRLATKISSLFQAWKNVLVRLLHCIVLLCQAIKQQSTEFAGGLNERCSEFAGRLNKRCSEFASGAHERIQDVKERMYDVKYKFSRSTASTLEGIKPTLPSVTGLTTFVTEGTSEAVAKCRAAAERLKEKFKVS